MIITWKFSLCLFSGESRSDSGGACWRSVTTPAQSQPNPDTTSSSLQWEQPEGRRCELLGYNSVSFSFFLNGNMHMFLQKWIGKYSCRRASKSYYLCTWTIYAFINLYICVNRFSIRLSVVRFMMNFNVLSQGEDMNSDSDEEPSPEALARYLAMRRHTVGVGDSRHEVSYRPN